MERGEVANGKSLLTRYADIVLIAKEVEDMRGMIERLERHLEKKGLELNIHKSKIMKLVEREAEGKRK